MPKPEYDAALRQLRQQVDRLQQLEAMRDDLCRQKQQLTEKIDSLARSMAKEQADVERLTGRSLAALFYQVTGQMEEKLTRERREAYAAQMKHATALREREKVEAALRRVEAERWQLRDSPARYEQCKAEKAAALRQSGSPAGRQLQQQEQQLTALEKQQKELNEAIAAGQAALQTAQRVVDLLDSAEGWATWDMLGGGLLSDMAKHSRLDEAQAAVEQLQIQLRRFHTELADVQIAADMQVRVEGFLQFADFFFDGLLVDWMVRDRIEQSRAQARQTRDQIEAMLRRLTDMARDAAYQSQQIARQREALLGTDG